MSIETIPSVLFTAGSGGIVGFLIGYAIKKVMKISAIIIGIFFGALIYLQTQGVIAINWEKLQSILESTLSAISSTITNTEQISIITANIGIPLTGGLSAGLVLGLSKG